MKDHITIEGRDGAFAAYIARPKTSPAPAVVVLQEIFGVNMDMRETCDELGAHGFIADCRCLAKSFQQKEKLDDTKNRSRAIHPELLQTV